MRNLALRVKILMSLGVLVAGFVFFSALMSWNTRMTLVHTRRLSTELLPAALGGQEAAAKFEKAAQHYQDAVVLQDRRSLEAAGGEISDSLWELEAVEQKVGGNALRRAEVGQLIEAVQRIEGPARTTYLTMAVNPESASAETLKTVAELARETRETKEAMQRLRLGVEEDFQREADAMAAMASRERMLGFAVFGVAVVWAVVSIVILERQIVEPLRHLSARLRDIALGDGDLTKRLQVHGRDELGQVSESFNLLMDRLQAILREVAESTVRLNRATQGISVSSRAMASRADAQQMEAEQIALTMREMATSVSESSRSSMTAAEKASHAAKTAQKSGNALKEAIATMRLAAQSVESTTTQVKRVEAESSEVGLVVDVIQEIADQTNLLALNAAIEAARAGSEGRGFAVVADEIRMLSTRTGEATTQIGEILTKLQLGTEAAAIMMREGAGQVQLAVDAAMATGENLMQIVEAVEQGSAMITRVAHATSQQSAATEQVTDNLGRIATSTKQTAEGAQESANASGELRELAGILQGMISRFRLEGEAV